MKRNNLSTKNENSQPKKSFSQKPYLSTKAKTNRQKLPPVSRNIQPAFLDPRCWWRNYVYLLDRYPWSAQLASGAFLGVLGSLISECVVQGKSITEVDWSVPARMILMGIFVFGPIIRTWLLFLERLVPGAGGWAGVKKMVIDQTVMAPFLLVVFTTCFVMMNGGSLQNVSDKLKRDGWTMLKNNWKLWPAVQLINFYLIPFNLRMVFSQAVALVWNVYIAFMFSGSQMPATSEAKLGGGSNTSVEL